MGRTLIADGSVPVRARAWRNAGHAAVCDTIEPWAHGTIVRAGRYPTYYDFNVVRVERETDLDVPALSALSDQALAGLGHRRLDFDLVEEAEARRKDFEAAGWKAMRLLWLRHAQPLPDAPPGPTVAEVPYELADALRLSWHLENRGDMEYAQYKVGAREVAMLKGARVLAVIEDGEAIAFAELQRSGGSAEIQSVYVHPEHRSRGFGTAITRAAIEASEGVGDLWIVADDEDRAKDLYARLGFRPAWTSEEFLRLP